MDKRNKHATAAQMKVLRLIADFIKYNKYSPTFKELADALGVSVKGAWDHVGALRRKGYLDWVACKSRTIHLTEKGNHVGGSWRNEND